MVVVQIPVRELKARGSVWVSRSAPLANTRKGIESYDRRVIDTVVLPDQIPVRELKVQSIEFYGHHSHPFSQIPVRELKAPGRRGLDCSQGHEQIPVRELKAGTCMM